MSGAIQTLTIAKSPPVPRTATAEASWVKWLLIGFVALFFAAFLVLPLVVIFAEAFSKGVAAYFAAFDDPATLASIKLTLITIAVAVPLNTIFGVAAAWAIARFNFKGKDFLIALIDLPLWVSPVVGGLIYILLLGPRQGLIGPWLSEPHDIFLPYPYLAHFTQPSIGWLWLFEFPGVKIIFAPPGIILATVFVTFPFVARGLIPLMQSQGQAEEEAAITLGANGWQVFRRVTLPKIKWGLIYGILLCNARAMGEFGAVSVVSGHIREQTNTMPLQVEILYNEYSFTAAFAVASVLSLLALVTLAIKTLSEWRTQRQFERAME